MKRSNNDNDNDNNRNGGNGGDGGNGGNGGGGGNNSGDGIFWPCNIPWFANNPACAGQLGSLLGR